MNNPNVRSGKPADTEFENSVSHCDAAGESVRLLRGRRKPLRAKSFPHSARHRSGHSFHAVETPFKRYADSAGDPVLRSMRLAQVQFETGKHLSTVGCYPCGETRPNSQNRRAIAFVVSKFTGCTVSGDALSPATYPYSGRLSRPQRRLAMGGRHPEFVALPERRIPAILALFSNTL